MNLCTRIALLAYKLALIPGIVTGQGMVIANGGHLIVGNGYVSVSRNLSNNGSYTDQGGTLIFNGAVQQITGTNGCTLNNFSVSIGSASILSTAGHTLKGVLKSNGTLNANGNLTLLSTAGQTALVDGSGTGTVTGNLSMQRYLPSGFGYRYISSPFQGSTVNSLSDDVNLGADFPTLYRYEENRDTAWWFSYVATGNELLPLAGYAANFGAVSDPTTFDLEGEVNNGDLTVALYNHNRTHTKGFNLIGNPYPSPIDWTASGGWTKTNVDNAIYYFNPGSSNQYVGSYSTYINGVSSDGIASNIIPAMQGFFVHVTDGSYPVTAALGFSNAVRINNLNPVFHKKGSMEDLSIIRISAGFEDAQAKTDPLVLTFESGASSAFNRETDAVKLMNTDPGVPSFYSVMDENVKCAIKALPEMTDTLSVIPLGINILQPGVIVFTVQPFIEQWSGFRLYFSDNRTGAVTDFQPGDVYRVFLDAGTYDDRFSLLMSLKEIQTSSGAADELNAFMRDGRLVVYLNLLNGEQGEVQVTDMVGRLIHREKVSGIGYEAIDLNVATGVYIVSLRTVHSISSKKLLISGK